MTKKEFLAQLRTDLSGLPEAEIEEQLLFYGEMIDDRMEEGLSEEEAVAQVANREEKSEPAPETVQKNEQPKHGRRHLQGWEIALLIIGAPLWLSLLITLCSVFLSLYVVIWAVLISFFAVEITFCACAAGGLFAGIFFIVQGKLLPGIAVIGAGITLAGLSILTYYGCKGAAKGILWLTKKTVYGIKVLFTGKEEAK